jgi:nickel-dependent lactate racemase
MSTTELSFGIDSTLCLDLPAGLLVEHCHAPRGQAVADAWATVAAALAQPLNYPPLAKAAFPGDRVVLAVADAVPRAADVLGAVSQMLVAAGASPDDITVLTPGAHYCALADVPTTRPDRPHMPRRLRLGGAELPHLVHDPADRHQVGLLARTADQMPIFLNRALLDADVVVSIGCLHTDDTLGYNGPGGSLCPTFSDQATQQRFRAYHVSEAAREHSARAQAKAHEVSWLLGAPFVVRVVPGRGEAILHVLSGEIDAVTARGRELCEAAWRYEVPRSASLVIAAIEGGPEQQTWENVGRAVATAANLAEPEGAIAVCCDLEAPPPDALIQLAAPDDPAEAVRHVRKSSPPDALAALELARAREELHVYLLSRLDRSDVEELGLVPVADGAELARLARSRPSCLVLSGGQHIRVAVRKA